ncbi:MobV family relaxase [Tenacibaculum larymnensis]|uniref:Plasmid recombination protein n=1 Tax=Tenacibaculum larymnensis TaxID=2878201 RepID=A0A9X4IKZ0_9FLAO|nr:MobV family relaxase [Tenacibaculum larymnensis]MDE1206034.1 plasmid recombination protein [Tenacibaculum larymnensis]
MSYAVMRCMKIKSNMNGIGKHIDRSYNGETISPQNANPKEVSKNVHWDDKGNAYSQKEWTAYTKDNPLQKRVNDKIRERYKLDKKIRKDAVKAIEYIFSSDHEKMNEIFKDENLYKSWMADNKKFVSDIYGEDNIVSMHLHSDEKTYHCEVVVTPITEDGRLSAKEFIDGKKDLSNQQTAYAEMMKKYGMERGELGSTAKHRKPNQYNKTQNYERNH